ncbi:PBP1A family penicillin-binding protein [Candidatus Microgenomates bacterium]|nr:PBP1A family penicillin-binding protein [Candidatus Microgenomates bacterium]
MGRMPRQKTAKKTAPTVLSRLGLILYALGQPVIFALRVLLWTVFWLTSFFVEIVKNIFWILKGTWDTFVWFLKTTSTALSELLLLIKRGWGTVKLPTIRLPKITFHKKSSIWWEKKRKSLSKHFVWKRENRLFYIFAGALVFFVFIFIPFWAKMELDKLPNPNLLSVRDISVSTKIYDRNGILLYQIYADENRSIVNLNQVPKHLVDATIAIEDRNFYHHLGFDPIGIARAAMINNNTNEISQGGSTITQQLIKSALLSPERTWQRKIKELVLSFWAERIYTKEQILTMYLNQIPYGGSAYGIEAASQSYFNKPAKNLTLAESALLAGLPSSPTTYSPFGLHPELAKQRQKMVLDSMVAQGYITQPQENYALSQPLKYGPLETSIKAPHFVMYVRDLLAKKYGNKRVEQGGLEVITTLDYAMYENVNKIVHDGVENQKYLNVGNGAALITNPKTGEILTMVGSTNFFDTQNDGNVNVTVALRSPGSSIKPLNYALAFENNFISPSAMIDDAPIIYRSSNGSTYAPQNYDNRFHGRVSVRSALACSYNIPAVKILGKNGVENFINFSKKLGITTFTDPTRYGLALTLGGGEVTMMDMAAAYSPLANQGTKVELNPIIKITDYRGKVLEEHVTTSESVISPKTAFLISDILADNNARTPAFGPRSALVVPNHTVSVKTGTTQEKRDNWTIGYTPSYIVAVWVGNNNNAPMSMALESGNTGAAAIWNPIMQSILSDKPDEGLVKPENVISVQVCGLNGLLPCANCPFVRTEYFVKGTEPKYACTFTKEEVEKILHPEKKEEKKN